jgi:uncharacterized protein (DUF302 family)
MEVNPMGVVPAVDGLRTYASGYGPSETLTRLKAAVPTRGMTIVAQIDHAAAATKVGMELRPTVVLIFGNPKVGTPLMQAVQTMGIDLPLRALVWADADGKTWIAYDDPSWITKRHGVHLEANQSLEAMTAALAAAVKETTAPAIGRGP